MANGTTTTSDRRIPSNIGSGSVLEIFNQYKNVMSLPFSFTKSGSESWEDLPADYKTTECTIMYVGDYNRTIVFAMPYSYGNNSKIYIRRIFNGVWNTTSWRELLTLPQI